MKNKLIKTLAVLLLTGVFATSVSAINPVTVNADESDSSYTVFIAVGANEDWSMCYAGENYADSTVETNPGITVTPGTIKAGETATVSLSFETPVNYIWYMTPVIIGSDITEADFSVTLYINGVETAIDSEGKDNWWYESTGPFDDMSTVRIYGGYNEFDDDHKYAAPESLTNVSEIKYVITANSINGVTGSAPATQIEVVDEGPGDGDNLITPVDNGAGQQTPVTNETVEKKDNGTSTKAVKVIAGVAIMLAGTCYAVILVRKMKR